MPTVQLIDLIIAHSVALVGLSLGIERAVAAAQPLLEAEWFYLSQRFLDFLDQLPLPKLAALTLGAVLLRSLIHLGAFYLH